MKPSLSQLVVLVASLFAIFSKSPSYAASPSSAVLQAKQEAEAKGYVFETSHDVIVNRAKKEARLRILSSFASESLKGLVKAFKQKYPFIDIRADEVAGTDTYQRMVLEMKAGTTRAWDVNYMTTDFYDEYLPYQKKFDLLGMAQHGVLRIPIEMIDPINRNIVAYSSTVQLIAYNSKIISMEKVPNSWEDFLKPELKGRKFVADIRPQEIAALVPAWGLEKTLAFARGIAAQEPIWARGHSRVLTAMTGGEYAILMGANLNSTKRAIDKDRTKSIASKVVEPVPVWIGEHEAVFDKAEYPYAGLLWLEFCATEEAQKIVDQGSYEGSYLFPVTSAHQASRGKKLSLVDWQHATKMQDYQKKVVEAYGFPRAENTAKK
jgi:ABC-type Fe3+ transport system substrate-binding protein